MIHKVEDRHKVDVFDALQVQQWMFMTVSFQDSPEEGGAGGENNLVRLDLIVVTGQGDVKKVFVLSEFPKG